MDDLIFERELAIRYVRLTFVLEMPEACIWPKSKVSALRGGMGEMLLRQNCVRDRNCDVCDFESECLVRRTIYSKYAIQPPFATGKDSIGYVLECHDFNTDFEAGQQLHFQLMLFGKAIVYLNEFLQAFYALGMNGIGVHEAHFAIAAVLNEDRQPIVSGHNVYMENYVIRKISDYVKKRMKKIQTFHEENNNTFLVKVRTPASVKYHGEFIDKFQPEAILQSIVRRVFMLDCYEGIPSAEEPEASEIEGSETQASQNQEPEIQESQTEETETKASETKRFITESSEAKKSEIQASKTMESETQSSASDKISFRFQHVPERMVPVLKSQTAIPTGVQRYSSTAGSKMTLHGIRGEMSVSGVGPECLELLLAAELTHIGKNTSFGFGEIILS